MKRFLLLVAALAACATPSTTATSAPATSAVASERWIDETLARLTLRERAAQMVWPTILGDFQATDAAGWRTVERLVREHEVGGFTVSVGSPTEIAAKLNAMQRMSDLPLLFGADYEFGAGYRARGGYFVPNAIDLGGAVLFPQQMALGAARDTALAYAQGRVTAIEGRAVGVHVAYSPILDVNNNAANPVINTRSFGEDPRLAARLGVALVRGLQEHGMIATGKHFPGHGDTDVNSHLALPTVTASRARLDSVELVPFRAAVEAGLGAMMTFHGVMPALDSSGVPGTLSRPVIEGVLRDELGFQGLVFSDAMDMRGVLVQFGLAEATKRAVAAGADVLIQPESVEEAIEAVVAGVREGRYPESRVTEAARRILAAKARLGLHQRRTVDLDGVRARVGTVDHAQAARTAAERSIVLVKHESGLLPLSILPRGARVLSVTVARRADLGAGTAFNAELRRRLPGLRAEFVNADDPAGKFAQLLAASDSARAVIVGSYMGHAWNATSTSAPRELTEFIAALAARGRTPIVVALGNPYFLQQVPAASTYLVAWGGFPVSQGAAARALLGEIPITGRLPIGIPGHAAIGAGIQRERGSPGGIP